MKQEVICCFCGNSLLWKDALHICIYIDDEADGSQHLCCHKECLRSRLHESVPLHPDLVEY